jgi:hypothetical protein
MEAPADGDSILASNRATGHRRSHDPGSKGMRHGLLL